MLKNASYIQTKQNSRIDGKYIYSIFIICKYFEKLHTYKRVKITNEMEKATAASSAEDHNDLRIVAVIWLQTS